MQKIRIGIELDHVIRDLNKQLAKCYQEEYDESIDLDELDYKDDILHTVCKFKSKKEMTRFLYSLYPLEIFGHADQIKRTLVRDLNLWIKMLKNQEKYDVEIFLYSLKECDITISASYFFISKLGSRVRKMVFPESIKELSDYGDIFITANKDVVKEVNKPTILIEMNFNKDVEDKASETYKSFDKFLKDENKLNKIVKIINEWNTMEKKSSLTWMKSLLSFLQKKIGI